MATTIQTLQERLDERARAEAKALAKEAISKLPRCAGLVTIKKTAVLEDVAGNVTIWWDVLRYQIERFFEEQFYVERLDALTTALVEDVVIRGMPQK